MTEIAGKARVPTEISAVIIRADGTRIDLGTISRKNWRWYSPGKWAAVCRTKKANRALAQGSKA